MNFISTLKAELSEKDVTSGNRIGKYCPTQTVISRVQDCNFNLIWLNQLSITYYATSSTPPSFLYGTVYLLYISYRM